MTLQERELIEEYRLAFANLYGTTPQNLAGKPSALYANAAEELKHRVRQKFAHVRGIEFYLWR